MPPSHMDAAVTRLLVATRQLLESLQIWATGRLSDQEVSDIYVKLGNDFNVAVIAFSEYKIPMDDLMSVPDDLRSCLESTLSLEASQENLETYLPQIRQIIVVLLQGLKDKQTLYKRRVHGRTGGGSGSGGAAGSSGTISGGRQDQGSAGHGTAMGDMAREGEGTPQSGQSVGMRTMQDEGRPNSQPSANGSFASHRVGSPDASSMSGNGSPYLGTERIPPGRSGSADGKRNRSPLSHPQQTFSSQSQHSDSQSTHSLPPLPSSVNRPPSRASSSNSLHSGVQQDFAPPQPASSASMPSRTGLPSRSNLRANHPLPPPPPDAFRPPRSRPQEGNVSPSVSGASLSTSGSGNLPYVSSDTGKPPSRSPGLSPSPLPPQAFVDGRDRISPHKVTLTDTGPIPPSHVYSTPSTRNNYGGELAQSNANGQAPSHGPGAYEPMTPPPRGQRRPPDVPPVPPNLGSFRSPPSHLMNQSRFSLDSDIDTPKSSRAGRDSTAVSEHSRAESSGSHGRRNSSIDAGSSMPTIVLPPRPPTPPPPPASPPPSMPLLNQESGLPAQASPAALAALTALQKSDLGRRASKRYSSYHLNHMLPSHSKGPSSSSLRFNGNVPPLPSPVRPQRRVSGALPPPMPAIPASPVTSTGPPTPMRSDRRVSGSSKDPSKRSQVPAESSADVAGGEETPTPLPSITETESAGVASGDTPGGEIVLQTSASPQMDGPDSPAPRSAPSISGLQVYLQYGRETKKVSLDSQQLSSVADLQGVFMSRFDYSPEGMELFPDVYIKDPATGIAYHLEDMEDIKPGALLSLNIDPLDQVKQHFDNTITGLSLEIKDLKNNLARSRRLSILQPETSLAERLSPQLKSVERMPTSLRIAHSPGTTPVPTFSALPPQSTESTESNSPSIGRGELQTQYLEVQSLRRDLGIMRQTYMDFGNSAKEAFQAMREQNQAVREVALSKLKGSRPLVNAGKAALEKQSSDTVEAVDGISDNIDSVKDDVVRRQILPRPGQLASMREELEKAKKQVGDLLQQVTLLMPTCKQTWNQELKNVVDEQKLLQHQQKLAADLEGDIAQAAEVFDTLEQYVAQRQMGMGAGKLLKKTYQRPPGEEEQAAVPNLLLEIRTKETDPNKRLRAIEQQQRAREKEKVDQGDEFTNELSGFVTSKKLKKTGGTEEAERLRLKRQDKSFRKMFEGKPVPAEGSEGSESNPATPREAQASGAKSTPPLAPAEDGASSPKISS